MCGWAAWHGRSLETLSRSVAGAFGGGPEAWILDGSDAMPPVVSTMSQSRARQQHEDGYLPCSALV